MNAIASGVITATVDGIAVRLSDLARKNEIKGTIKIGDECYQLGEPSILPDGYERFRWVTEDQFESLLPPGINQDRYITITNTIPSDEAVEEWYTNWNDPEYWSTANVTVPIEPSATMIRKPPPACVPSPHRR